MRTITPELYAEIQAGTICNIMRIELQNGTVFGYTDHDEVISYGGLNYVPAPGLQKVKMTLTASSEVSNQELASAWVDAPEEDLKSGKFDSADVVVSWISWANIAAGAFDVFNGKLGEISWTDAGFKADIFSNMKALEQNIGEVFTANCRHVLFSQDGPNTIGACRLVANSFKTTGAVTSIVKNRWSFQTSISQPDDYCSAGRLTFTTGNNAGLSFVVKKQTGGLVELFLPTSFQVQVGDQFEIFAGCDKTIATCKNKFNNVVNFGGFPDIQADVSFR